MAADLLQKGIEQLIRKMMVIKREHINKIQKNLYGMLSDSEIESHEIERIINNYEAICGRYIRQSQKKILRSLGYLNNRLYLNMKSEISTINGRINRLTEKIERLERRYIRCKS